MNIIDKLDFILIINNLNNIEFIDKIAEELSNGINIVICKQNFTSTCSFIQNGRKIRQLCSIYNALFIVYDRIDIARILSADGIHLDSNSINIIDAKKLLDDDKIIGYFIDKDKQNCEFVEYFDYILTDSKDYRNENLITFELSKNYFTIKKD